MMRLKNKYKSLMLFILFTLSISGYSMNKQHYELNEGIKSVYNISTLNKRDNTVNNKTDVPVPNIDNKAGNIKEMNIIEAIKTKLGIKYVWGAVGPTGYDCSGFVYRVYKDINKPINRLTARKYWKKYRTATKEEQYKTGTLVFFNKLRHVGIVLDENGFYHASKSKGITYSKFNEYWNKRIVGFKVID